MPRSRRPAFGKRAKVLSTVEARRLQWRPRMKNKPRRRRTRPLLLAGAALSASLASTACPGPFGNLRAPNCDASPQNCGEPADLAVPDMGFGNLRAPVDMSDKGD